MIEQVANSGVIEMGTNIWKIAIGLTGFLVIPAVLFVMFIGVMAFVGTVEHANKNPKV